MTYLKKYVYPWFVDMASFASIIGLIIAFVSDDRAVFIALVTFCLVKLIHLLILCNLECCLLINRMIILGRLM